MELLKTWIIGELKKLAIDNNINLNTEGKAIGYDYGNTVSFAIYPPNKQGDITWYEAEWAIEQKLNRILIKGKDISIYINTTDLLLEISEAPETYTPEALKHKVQIFPNLNAFYQAE